MLGEKTRKVPLMFFLFFNFLGYLCNLALKLQKPAQKVWNSRNVILSCNLLLWYIDYSLVLERTPKIPKFEHNNIGSTLPTVCFRQQQTFRTFFSQKPNFKSVEHQKVQTNITVFKSSAENVIF